MEKQSSHAISTRVAAIRDSLLAREEQGLSRQQLIVFLLFTLSIEFGLALNLIGLTGPQDRVFQLINVGFLVVVTATAVLYFMRKITMIVGFSSICVIFQVFTMGEMLMCAISPNEYNLQLIVGDTGLLACNIMMALVAYLEFISYLLCASSIITYATCAYITGNEPIINFAILFSLIFLLISLLGNRLAKYIKWISTENVEIKREDEEILNVLRLQRSQVKAYIELAKERHDFYGTTRLLDNLGLEMQRTLLLNVKEYLERKDMEQESVSSRLPELSPSETEICRLIIQGKKQNEICTILGKKESNISCQRTNIRRKLNLTPDENLKKALIERLRSTK